MSIELGDPPAYRADAWLRNQRARIEQRHLQFGRHCRLEVGRLLMRMAQRVKVAPLAEVEMEREDGAMDSMQCSTFEGADHWMPSEVRCTTPAFDRSPTSTAMPRAPAPDCRARGPATLGDFVPSNRANDFSCREWVATLADRTTVVVNDWRDSPSVVGVEKAVSIVQSRAYLEHRARRLLVPFTEEAGSWRLVTIDFGTDARRQGCEFLMCFAFRATNSVLSITSPSVEIGFALPLPAAMDP
ncbi:MAG: hypothetical protein ABI460_07540, partial [Caldimonas sp.]